MKIYAFLPFHNIYLTQKRFYDRMEKNYTGEGTFMIQKRNIAVCILLSLVTCGIYGLYWLACLANDTNTASGRSNDTSGGMVVLFSIITCNIYHIYWMYKAGEKIDAARQMRGLPSQNNGLVYLLLTLFGFSIIAWAPLQNELNNMSDARPAM